MKEKKDKSIVIRVTSQEKTLLQEMARKNNMTVTQLLLSVIK